MAYEDTVLIKLRRQYSRDESMMFLINKVKELKIEKGKYDAYVEELNQVILEKEKINTVKENKTIQNLKNQIKILNSQLDNLRKESEIPVLKTKLKSRNIENDSLKLDVKKGKKTNSLLLDTLKVLLNHEGEISDSIKDKINQIIKATEL